MPVTIEVTCNPSPNICAFIIKLYEQKPSEVTGEGRDAWLKKFNQDIKDMETSIEQIAQIAFNEGRNFQKEHPNILK